MTQVTLNLTKGEKIDLTKTNPGLKSVKVGLGWDVNAGTGDSFDLDAFAFGLRETPPRLKESGDVLYFGSPATGNASNPKERGVMAGALTHSGDNLTGAGDGDDETMTINFDKLPADVNEVVVGVSIYKAAVRGGQTFGRVKNSYSKIYDGGSNVTLANYDLNEDYSSFNAIVVGKFYRHNGEWKFQTIGEGKNGDLNAIATSFS